VASAVVSRPDTVDLRLYQGDDVSFPLTVTDLASLAGATVLAQIRQTTLPPASSSGSGPPVLATFTSSVAGNVVTLTLAGSAAAGIPARAVWDCQITDSTGRVRTVAAGTVYMSPEVSR